MSVFSLVLSHLNKNLKRRTLESSACHSSWTDHLTALRSRTDHVIALRQISVTAPCYSSILFRKQQENPSSRKAWGYADPKMRREESGEECQRAGVGGGGAERETPGPLAPLFICFFLPLDLPYVSWDSKECCVFYLTSSLQSLELPLFYFRGLFLSLSFSHHHSGLLFPILTT